MARRLDWIRRRLASSGLPDEQVSRRNGNLISRWRDDEASRDEVER